MNKNYIKNKIEFVKEEKIETICDIKIAKKVIQELRKAHPYEEPAINIIPLINEEDLQKITLKGINYKILDRIKNIKKLLKSIA